MGFCSKTPTRHAPHANFSNQNRSSPSEEQRTNLLKNKKKQKFLPLFHPGFLKALDHVLIFFPLSRQSNPSVFFVWPIGKGKNPKWHLERPFSNGLLQNLLEASQISFVMSLANPKSS